MLIDNPSIFADKFRVPSSRLKDWDYSSPAFYFVTICTLNMNNFFGKIENNKILLSEKGKIAQSCLVKTPKHFNNIKIDTYIFMPNHIHLIIQILPHNPYVETRHAASLPTNSNIFYKQINQKSNQSISKIIRSFKSAVTKQCREQKLFFGWQSRFYDHIIQNKKEYYQIKKYIYNNPINWLKDPYH